MGRGAPRSGGVPGATRSLAIERFLGASAAGGGPFALLGLTPEDCSEALVILQLQRRLEQVGKHAAGGTAEADEVRMALHAAAAQLLERATPGGVGVEEVARALGMTPGAIEMEHVVLTTIAMHGGWNREALRWAMVMAGARGARAGDLVSAVERISRRPTGGRGARGRREIAGVRLPSRPVALPMVGRSVDVDPSSAMVKRVVVVLGIAVAAAVVGLGALAYALKPGGRGVAPAMPAATAPERASEASRGSGPTGEGTGREVEPGVGAGEVAKAPAVVEATEPARVKRFAEVLSELRGAVRGVGAEGGVERLVGVVRRVGANWTMATADELGAAQDAVVEGVYRVSASPTDLARVLGAIGSGAGVVSEKGEVASWRVAEAMWTGGMAARLMRERDLPPVAGRWIQGLTDEGSWRGLASEESTFSGGGAVGAMALVPRLVPREVSADAEASTKGWKAWVEGVGKLSLPERNRERLVLMALDAVLRDGADPMINKAAFDAVGELCGAVSWREGSEARGWLMRWFDSPGVTSGDLHAVTVALVGRVRAPGLDSTMALPGSADESARAELRDRYREAWGLEALGARDARASAWVEWAEEVKGNGRGQGGAGALARAVRLARVNLAAEAIAQGRTGYFKPSDADVAALEEGAGRSAAGGGWTGAPRRAPADVLTPEVAWAARYAGARSNIPVRRELLAGYVPSEEWIDLEASLIVQEAVRGSPDDVRGMARRIVETQRGRAAFVNALLNEVATMPAVKGNVALVAVVSGSRVPGVKDAGWRVGARRALVERLLELVAGTGERSTVDGLAALLEEAYAKRAALAGASPSAPPESAAELEKKEKGEEAGEAGEVAAATPGGVAPGAEESARALASRLALAARDRIATGREVYTLEEIRSRREGRLKLARGRVQEFAVEQLAVCETLAYVTAGEVPGRAERVLGILSQLAEERRGAKGVLEQVEACERAMTELWLVRLKGGSA